MFLILGIEGRKHTSAQTPLLIGPIDPSGNYVITHDSEAPGLSCLGHIGLPTNVHLFQMLTVALSVPLHTLNFIHNNFSLISVIVCNSM